MHGEATLIRRQPSRAQPGTARSRGHDPISRCNTEPHVITGYSDRGIANRRPGSDDVAKNFASQIRSHDFWLYINSYVYMYM